MAPKIGEEEARFWDILVKVIGGVIAIGTIFVGFKTLQRQGEQLKIQQSEFETTSKEQAKALEEEYHRRFWEKKLEVYLQLCHAAGILALTDPTSDEYQQAQHQLKMIYSGELQLLASSDVKTAPGDFLNALSSTSITKSRDFALETPTIEDKVKKGEKVELMDLHFAVANLALACRQDSGSEFHLNDQQVKKYKADVEGLTNIFAKTFPQGIVVPTPPADSVDSISFQSDPPGASILLDGKPPQGPSKTFTHVPFGMHRLTATLDGYEPIKQDIEVRRGIVPEIRLKLKRMVK